MQTALRLVHEAGGQMPLRDILSRLPLVVVLDARDLETHKTGGVRWSTALQFYAINYEKAGFIARDRGVWSITPEGAHPFRARRLTLSPAVEKPTALGGRAKARPIQRTPMPVISLASRQQRRLRRRPKPNASKKRRERRSRALCGP